MLALPVCGPGAEHTLLAEVFPLWVVYKGSVWAGGAGSSQSDLQAELEVDRCTWTHRLAV